MWRGLTGRDGIAGLAAIAIAASYLVFAYDIRRSALADAVGPGGVPKVLGWSMMALGAVLLVQGVLKARRSASFDAARPADPVAGPAGRSDARSSDDPDGEWTGQGRKLARAGGMLLIAVIYIALVGWLGYPISIALAIAAVALFLGAAPSWRIAAVAIGGSLALWVIFDRLLGVPLPVGSMFEWVGAGR